MTVSVGLVAGGPPAPLSAASALRSSRRGMPLAEQAPGVASALHQYARLGHRTPLGRCALRTTRSAVSADASGATDSPHKTSQSASTPAPHRHDDGDGNLLMGVELV